MNVIHKQGMVSVENQLAIGQLISLYGHLLDDREYHRLSEIFTADACFDLSGYDGSQYSGLAAIIELMETSQEHPVAHHASNVVIVPLNEKRAAVKSKGIGVGRNGRVGSVTYDDVVVLSEIGWRISERKVTLQRAATTD